MAKCVNCSAPLLANSNKCIYCSTRNDVDLTNKYPFSIIRDDNSTLCPTCEKTLQTIEIDVGNRFILARCENCYGLFLDQGKIETLLEKTTDPVYQVNIQQLDNINEDRFSSRDNYSYLKCPVCRMHMNRNVFGYRSGVIIDRCRSHGIWLESGELTHLLEWKRAGGQLLHNQKVEENLTKPKNSKKENLSTHDAYHSPIDFDSDLVNLLGKAIGKLLE